MRSVSTGEFARWSVRRSYVVGRQQYPFVDDQQHLHYVVERQQSGRGTMRMQSPTEIGSLVRATRLEGGLTQSQLGAKIGASRFWVAEFERGKPRAELGLALKALRALGLVLTIEPRDLALRREERERTGNQTQTLHPIVDLAAILNRSTSKQRKRNRS